MRVRDGRLNGCCVLLTSGIELVQDRLRRLFSFLILNLLKGRNVGPPRRFHSTPEHSSHVDRNRHKFTGMAQVFE